MKDGNKDNIELSLLAFLITPEALAKRLGVSEAWINTRIKASGIGRLPYYKIGNRVWFSVPEVEDYLRIYGKD